MITSIIISGLIALIFAIFVYIIFYVNQASATIDQLKTKIERLEQVSSLDKEISSTQSLLIKKQMGELHQMTQSVVQSVANQKSLTSQAVSCDTSYISYIPQIVIIGGVIVGFCFVYKSLFSSTAESALILENQKDISLDAAKNLQKLLESLLVNDNAPIHKQFEAVSNQLKELDNNVQTYGLEILRNQTENKTMGVVTTSDLANTVSRPNINDLGQPQIFSVQEIQYSWIDFSYLSSFDVNLLIF